MGLRPHGDNDCIQEVARVEEEDGGGGLAPLAQQPERPSPNPFGESAPTQAYKAQAWIGRGLGSDRGARSL